MELQLRCMWSCSELATPRHSRVGRDWCRCGVQDGPLVLDGQSVPPSNHRSSSQFRKNHSDNQWSERVRPCKRRESNESSYVLHQLLQFIGRRPWHRPTVLITEWQDAKCCGQKWWVSVKHHFCPKSQAANSAPPTVLRGFWNVSDMSE